MVNEKRLIDTKPLMQSGWHLVRTGESNKFLASMSLADVPTVDAVEVVRCKDCKSFGIYECSGNGYCKHDNGIADPEPNAFCSYGERKDNG